MEKNKVFLLSHQDDEMGVFNHIKNINNSTSETYIFFLTNGNIGKSINSKLIKLREQESIKVLTRLGIKKKNIFFIGKKLKTCSYKLHEKIDSSYKLLSKFFQKQKKDTIIFSHAWEGGNTDHDTSYVITLKLIKNFSIITNAYQFALYNSYNMPLKLYRVLEPIKTNGQIIKKNINFSEKIQFIRLLFYYKSQIKVWFGLYPFIITKILLNRYGHLQSIRLKRNLKKPHKNKLWYEKRQFASFNSLKVVFDKFLK